MVYLGLTVFQLKRPKKSLLFSAFINKVVSKVVGPLTEASQQLF